MTEPKREGYRGMLPGMAAIALFLLFVSMISGFQVMHAKGIPPVVRYGILSVCTMVVLGVLGFLRMRRWGWALISAGAILGALANFYAFHRTHMSPYLIQGLFLLVFFIYLARPEVRERLH